MEMCQVDWSRERENDRKKKNLIKISVRMKTRSQGYMRLTYHNNTLKYPWISLFFNIY